MWLSNRPAPVKNSRAEVVGDPGILPRSVLDAPPLFSFQLPTTPSVPSCPPAGKWAGLTLRSVLTKKFPHALFGAFPMSDPRVLSEVQKILKNERAFLPVSVLLASAVAFVVVWYRLDHGPEAFLAGLLVGGLGVVALAGFVYVVRLSTALRGEKPSGLLEDARRLASSR